MYINESEFNIFRAKNSDRLKDNTQVKSQKELLILFPSLKSSNYGEVDIRMYNPIK